MSSEQHFKPKQKKIPADLDPRDHLLPPELRDYPNVIIPDELIGLEVERNANEKENEKWRQASEKEQQRQQAILAEREQKKIEEDKRLREARKLHPVQDLRNFAAGKRSYCGCNFKLRFEKGCTNPADKYPIAISIEPLMSDLRRLVNIIGIDEVLRLLGNQRS
jgi:hypothetical protein